MPADCRKAADRPKCEALAADKTVLDDDEINAIAPDFGLDWDYSHGVGIGQTTIFPTDRCPDGSRGKSFFGRCFTLPEMVTVEGGVEAMVRALKQIQNTCGPTDPACVFAKYRGGDDRNNADVQKRVRTYWACVARFNNLDLNKLCVN